LMAGLWEARRDPADESLTQLSCTILTTEALGPLRRVHERMPLVVSSDVLGDWLDPDVIGDPRALVDGAGYDLEQWAEAVEIHPVSRAVSNVRNDGPELVRPVDLNEGTRFCAALVWWARLVVASGARRFRPRGPPCRAPPRSAG